MSDFNTAFPNSRRIYVDGPQDVRVPMREIALSGGEPPLRVYDTSGPQGIEAEQGLPRLREPWVKARTGGTGKTRVPAPVPVTQLYYARRGDITPEQAVLWNRR